jgi:hypothetical protein
LQIFVPARAFADDHEPGAGIALAEHHVRPPLRERAKGAREGHSFDVG